MERLLAIRVAALEREVPDGSTLRDSLALLDALVVLCPFTEPVRLGLYTLPLRGPSRFFGGEDAVFDAVRATVRDVVGHEASLGVADGLFSAELAARAEVIVPPGATEAFRRGQAIDVLGRRDLATTGRRLGLYTVGAFADLDRARVTERFDASALVLHRVARGELDALVTQRDRGLAGRLERLRGESGRHDEQMDFFGGRGIVEERARAAAHRVRRRLGPDAILVATLHGGRAPEDRAVLVPWGSPVESPDDAPWPGQLRAPSPVTVLAHRVAVRLCDEADRPVHVGARGLLNGSPAGLVLARHRRDVVWYAGPWPSVERWWGPRRRRAHLQVALGGGEALLLVAEAGRWWLVGIYD